LTAFGWWFAAGKLDPGWALSQLRDILRLAHAIDAETIVLERLATGRTRTTFARRGMPADDCHVWATLGHSRCRDARQIHFHSRTSKRRSTRFVTMPASSSTTWAAANSVTSRGATDIAAYRSRPAISGQRSRWQNQGVGIIFGSDIFAPHMRAERPIVARCATQTAPAASFGLAAVYTMDRNVFRRDWPVARGCPHLEQLAS
jgi:hypothetical protein